MTDITKAFAPFFKAWSVKSLGPKPTASELETVIALGLRMNQGKQVLANAMYLRDCGATSPQVVQACGAPQLNKMRELIERKLVKRDMNMAPNEAGHTVYKITLAAKGEAAVTAKATQAADELAGKVAKGKAKHKAAPGDRAARKARQVDAKAAKVEPVTQVEAAQVEAEISPAGAVG